jgi:hypothetical protein
VLPGRVKEKKNFLFRRRNVSKLWQRLHQSQLNRQPRKKNNEVPIQFTDVQNDE